MTTLVTGAAGFIGHNVVLRLMARGESVVGLDNVNDYYDPKLKEARLARLTPNSLFQFEKVDLLDRMAIERIFTENKINQVVHLAAQAGVRYSITHPHAYIDSNITGTLNILEAVRQHPVRHLVYASSSSVYGANTQTPFSPKDRVDHPVSLYAASKRMNELNAEVYARQFGIPATGLRFFTVYGPWGRPDMAAFLFVRAILADQSIDVFNHGDMQRDFTYIDDIVEGVLRVLDKPPIGTHLRDDHVPHRIYNIGNHQPEALMHFIEIIGRALGKTPKMNMLPMQLGDVKATYADTDDLRRDFDWQPSTPIEEGLPRFVAWYRDFYRI